MFDSEYSKYFMTHAVNYLMTFEPQVLYKDAVDKLDEILSTPFDSAGDSLKILLALKEPEQYIKRGLAIIESHFSTDCYHSITVKEALDISAQSGCIDNSI